MIYDEKFGHLTWAADRAQGAGLFHVAALIRSAMTRIEAEPTYDEECNGCRRFYGDLYEETSK